MTDFLSVDALPEGEFRLVDIDPVRLDLARRFAEHLIERAGKAWTVRSDVDRTAMLAGSDVVINTIEVAGLRNVRHDFDIPMRYGVDQCIGDTIGPGGLFKAFRTIPAWLEILADIERLCPEAPRVEPHEPDVDDGARGIARIVDPRLRHVPLGALHGRAARGVPRGRPRPPDVPRGRREPSRVDHGAVARRRGCVPAVARAWPCARGVGTGPRPVRADVPPRAVPDRVERARERVPAVLPVAPRDARAGTRAPSTEGSRASTRTTGRHGGPRATNDSPACSPATRSTPWSVAASIPRASSKR